MEYEYGTYQNAWVIFTCMHVVVVDCKLI